MTSDHPNRSRRTRQLTPGWWDEPLATPGRRSRTAIAVMLLGAMAPFILGVDAVMGPRASSQFVWSSQIDRAVHSYAATLRQPKIIFIGGSNVIFGLHARDLERALGVPVLAYGINAGAGLDIMALRAAEMIGPGDLVIAQPELHHFARQGPQEPALRRDYITIFKVPSDDPVGRFPRREWVAIRARARRILTRIDQRAADIVLDRLLHPRPAGPAAPAPDAAPNSPYDSRSIDERGNLIFPRPRPTLGFNSNAPKARPDQYDWKDSEGIAGLRTLADLCQSRGATLAIAPAVMARTGNETEVYTAAVRQREAEMLKAGQSMGATILLGPGQTTLDRECVYDTTFHLNDKGVALMQERWLEALRPYAEKMKQPRD